MLSTNAGARVQERVDRAGGSSRILTDVDSSEGLADLPRVCLALRGVSGGVGAAMVDFCFRDGVIIYGSEGIGEIERVSLRAAV